MTCGIYSITNVLTGQVYIGKSRNVERRLQHHRNTLSKNKHFNRHLQNSYCKYGASNFDFKIVEACPEELLIENEQRWINASNKLFNKIKDVIKHTGETFLGKRHNSYTKLKMSMAKIGRYQGPDNPNYGRKASKNLRLKMILNNGGTKLTPEKVLAIKEMLISGQAHKEIAEKFGVNRSVITRIASGNRWSIVTGGPIKKE